MTTLAGDIITIGLPEVIRAALQVLGLITAAAIVLGAAACMIRRRARRQLSQRQDHARQQAAVADAQLLSDDMDNTVTMLHRWDREKFDAEYQQLLNRETGSA